MQLETHNINIDDSALVQQCQKGDSKALERLIIKYQGRIYNVILKICANPDDAVELTQETFVKVMENMDKFAGKSSFYTWIFRIAVNLTLNYCKRNVKIGFRSLEAEELGSDSVKQTLKDFIVNSSAPDPAVVTQNKELCSIVMDLLMKLDEEQRTVVVLRDIESMSYEKIAIVTNTELGTVKSRLSRARNNLHEMLEAILK
ncbi:MAG TPA: sigma-70 family RNA polymerase sigma factor [Sedimentisphaerales bacterium]|nr:sigma-70 family RNA polymerase sigma factor [Sedimentisphaerales bacterium]